MKCQVEDLGLIEYKDAWELQKQIVVRVREGEPQRLLVCEHKPVLTLGRLADPQNLLISNDKLKEREIEIYNVDRGGEITLHCPGQLVIYPIFDLNYYGKDLHLFMHQLEQIIIDLLGDFDIVADRSKGQTGVWVDQRKIASIGIGVKGWISFHGLSLNVNTDLSLYSIIKPCGLNVEMTSLQALKSQPIDINSVKSGLIDCFCKNFHLSYIIKG